MYHAVVRSKIRSLFDAVNRGDAEPVITGFAASFEHRFLGEDHALGGSRTTVEATRAWYGRLYRLLPDIHFDVGKVAVIAVIDWIERNSGTDGVMTSVPGIHVVHIAWGKMTRLIICPHTDGVRNTLDRLYAFGTKEAHADPIVG